jgi:hypothetical protein
MRDVSIPNGTPQPFRQGICKTCANLPSVSIPNGLPRLFSRMPLLCKEISFFFVSIPNGLPRLFSRTPLRGPDPLTVQFQSPTGFPGYLARERTEYPTTLALVSIPNGLPRLFSLSPSEYSITSRLRQGFARVSFFGGTFGINNEDKSAPHSR